MFLSRSFSVLPDAQSAAGPVPALSGIAGVMLPGDVVVVAADTAAAVIIFSFYSEGGRYLSWRKQRLSGLLSQFGRNGPHARAEEEEEKGKKKRQGASASSLWPDAAAKAFISMARPDDASPLASAIQAAGPAICRRQGQATERDKAAGLPTYLLQHYVVVVVHCC